MNSFLKTCRSAKRFACSFPVSSANQKHPVLCISARRDYYNSRQENSDSRQNRRTGSLHIFSGGLLVGLCAGAALKSAFEELTNREKLFTVTAAVPTEDHDKTSGSSAVPPSRAFNFIADVVDKTAPSVVYIEITGRHPFMNRPVVLSNGSGFIIESDGLILTNAHVVADQSYVTVKLYDGRVMKGVVENRDLTTDLATVRINAHELPTLPLGETVKLRPGEWVVAMGSPLTLSNTITAGVVSSVHRASKELGLQHSEMEYIQTDAAINFGNSGGPLVNLDGEAIGINTMKVTAGISFAIPIDYAVKFLKESKEKRKSWWGSEKTQGESGVRRYLGVTMLTLTPSILHELQQRRTNFPAVQSGVLIWKVGVGSPAESAGLAMGDVITHIDGKAITSSKEVYRAVESGKLLTLTVRRDREIHTVHVQPQEVLN